MSDAYIQELGGACVEMARGIGAGVDDTYIHGSAGACMEVGGCNDVTGGVVDDVVPAFQSEVDIGNALTSDAENDAVVELSDELKFQNSPRSVVW